MSPQLDFTGVLLYILDIIHYQNNKKTFIDNFMRISIGKTYERALESLPQEKQNGIKQRINSSSTFEEKEQMLLTYVSQEQYQQIFYTVIQLQFKSYLETIFPVITKEEKEKITSYITSLGNLGQNNSTEEL